MENLKVRFFLLFFLPQLILAQTNWYVNSLTGNDAFTGIAETVGIDGYSGPKKTIDNAAIAANSGDKINVIYTGVPYYETKIDVTKNLIFNAYGNGDIIIDLTNSTIGIRFTMPGTTTFTCAGTTRIVFKGTSQVGFNLVSGRVFLETATVRIQPPFLFQNNLTSNTSGAVNNWFVNKQTGNYNYNGLSALVNPPNGPLPNIFHVYAKVPAPYTSLENDQFNVASGEYADAPVIINNIIINGLHNNNLDSVIFNLINTDLHFSMTGRTIFGWQSPNSLNTYLFTGSSNTGMVFKTGCVEFRDVPVEIRPPFLFKRIPSYCDVDPPTIEPIPFVVYGNEGSGDRRVYHTIGIYTCGSCNTRCWLKENLNIGKIVNDNGFNDLTNNNVIEKYCYNNQLLSCDVFGGLYQWAEALQYYNGANNDTYVELTGKIRGICPPDWHLPTHDESSALADQDAGGNTLKSIGVGSINTSNGHDGQGTNTTGFSALFAGWRNPNILGTNTDLWNQWGVWTAFWSADQFQLSQAKVSWLISTDYMWGQGAVPEKKTGLSVRCIHDTWVGSPGQLYTEVEEQENSLIPGDYTLLQNYPNPFNPATTIMYEMLNPGKVKIEIFDIAGRNIKTLVNKDVNSGKHSVLWDGKDNSGKQVTSGTYFYNLTINGVSLTKKMLLIR